MRSCSTSMSASQKGQSEKSFARLAPLPRPSSFLYVCPPPTPLHQTAKPLSPSWCQTRQSADFQDEIDALGSARSEDTSHSGVLTSLLNEMDGIEELAGVTVVAATNRPDVLDGALMRPGRLDRILFVGAPDATTRRDIFKICLARMAVEEGVDVEQLAMIVCPHLTDFFAAQARPFVNRADVF